MRKQIIDDFLNEIQSEFDLNVAMASNAVKNDDHAKTYLCNKTVDSLTAILVGLRDYIRVEKMAYSLTQKNPPAKIN